jgi:methylenetetrahydrofolate reductase (NADPH)
MRIFNDDISTPEKFVVTLEPVPGREISGAGIDAIKQISKDAYDDGAHYRRVDHRQSRR